MIEITDEDIEKVEQKFNLTFDNESKEFIRCMESKDIQACPGAGKTTSLVAKLDILANHMPFGDNSGILVLTHTNVAVGEIKKKLGVNAKKVLGYPNHIGTFQSFVNKFLAIPMYIKMFNKKPEQIDSDVYYSIFQKKFDTTNEFHRNWLQERADERFVNVLHLVENLDVQETTIQYEGKNLITTKSRMFSAIRTISNIPYYIVENGFLTYEHCYQLAEKYITDYPNVFEIFQKRFKYIFIDEAQDTDDRQFEIIKKLFENSDVIIQKIGDNNQAIFNFSGQKAKGWNLKSNPIEIKDTKRLSILVSNQVSKVALIPQVLNGNDIILIQPTIIIFDDEYIEQVLHKFSELIIEHNLHTKNNITFKAVGGVAKLNDKGHTLSSYFPNYKKDEDCSSSYTSLQDKLKYCIVDKLKPSEYRSIILEIIKEYTRRKDIKDNDKVFSKHTILTYLKEHNEKSYNEFKLGLLEITKKLDASQCILNELQYIIEIFINLFSETFDLSTLNTVIENYKLNLIQKKNTNIYFHENENVEVEISTIHKVKGETHTATLVLETFKDGYDVFQLLDYLIGNSNKLKTDNKKKLLYVAMSRPTDLLCLAIHKKHIHRKKEKEITESDIDNLRTNGFTIIELKEDR